MRPVVVAVAITGSVPRKKDNPALPTQPAEQIESTHAAYEAGATLVHIHVRNDDEMSSSDTARFAAVQEGVRKHCPGMIIQFSTGGRGRASVERGSSLYLKPDMASLATGSVNFPLGIYDNFVTLVDDLARQLREHNVRPEIEIFDLSHIHAARRLIDEGRMDDHPHVQFVLGVKNALPAAEHLVDVLLAEKNRELPNATWTAAGIGAFQAPAIGWALKRGAQSIRTGLVDNIRAAKDRLASSNAELVQIAVKLMAEHDCRPATTAEARKILSLSA